MGVGRAFAALRNWQRQRVAATGIVVGRRVARVDAGFVVLLDLHFEYEGRSHQVQARAAAFDDAGQAQAGLAKWPIGSFERLTFLPGCPEVVSLRGDDQSP